MSASTVTGFTGRFEDNSVAKKETLFQALWITDLVQGLEASEAGLLARFLISPT